MSVISIQPTFPQFEELDGTPLETGFIYIGTANLNPETNPTTVYWDFALTIPATQPIRTIGGRPSRGGSAARVYIQGDYSMTVRAKGSSNQPGVAVYSALSHPESAALFDDLADTTDVALGDALIGVKHTGTGAVARTQHDKNLDSLSAFDFMTIAEIADVRGNTAAVDVSAALLLAITSAYTLERSLYFPAGTYLVNTNIKMGDNATDAAKFCNFHGDGQHTVIKTTSANVNPFLWEGPNPDVASHGNRIDGRILIEKMRFLGPSSFGANTNSIGIRFYGAQGINLRDVTFNGWYDGEHYQNCDIVGRFNVISQTNYNAVNSSASGYAITAEGQLNSFNTFGGLTANNTNAGISYVGGHAPCFYGANFVLNGISLEFSPNNAAGNTVTSSPTVNGCYFEADTVTSIKLGGGNGIVRGGYYTGGGIIAGAAVPMVTVANYSNAFDPGYLDIPMNITFAGSSAIDQTSSAEKLINRTQITYTPTWAADSGSLVIGDGAISGKYRLDGDLCHVEIFFKVGATTTLGAASPFQFGLPFTATPSAVAGLRMAAGTAYINDTGSGWATAVATIDSGSVAYCKLKPAETIVNSNQVQSDFPMVFAAGDYITINLAYQIVLP